MKSFLQVEEMHFRECVGEKNISRRQDIGQGNVVSFLVTESGQSLLNKGQKDPILCIVLEST